MSQRYQYYFLQPVTEEELNEGFAGLENADRALMTDQGLVGIFSGGAVAQHAPVANLTVDVSGPVIGYDDFGQRILAPGPTLNVNVAQDSSSVSTAVAGSSNEKWVSIALQFTRVLTDPREDGNSQTVYFNEAESYLVIVTQGAEAAVGTAPRPSIDPDNLLLCDVNLRFGTTQVLNAAIDTTRRQDVFVMAGSPFSIRSGTLFGAVESMLGNLNEHINNLVGAHPASAIAISGLSAWADGTLNSGFTDLYDFLETGLITALASYSGGGGTAKIAGGRLIDFIDGQSIGPETLLEQLNDFVAMLSSSTVSHDGARRVYYNPAGSTTPLTATSVGAALDQLDSNSHATQAALAGIGGTSIYWTAQEFFDALIITPGHHVATVTPEAQAITTAAGAVPPSSSRSSYYFALPDGATLTGVEVWINSLSGSHTSWPVPGLANATFFRWTINGGATAVIGGGTFFDPAVNLAASNAGRAIACTITGEPAFNRATTLYQVLYGQEAGSGSSPETITGIVVNYTPSQLSPAPG